MPLSAERLWGTQALIYDDTYSGPALPAGRKGSINAVAPPYVPVQRLLEAMRGSQTSHEMAEEAFELPRQAAHGAPLMEHHTSTQVSPPALFLIFHTIPVGRKTGCEAVAGLEGGCV